MRPTTCIRAKQAREITRAANHAWRIGQDLTRYIVINFPQPGEGDELLPAHQFREIRRKAWGWWSYKRKHDKALGRFTDLHSWEDRNDIRHVNWLVHIPRALEAEFSQKLEKWITKVVGDHPVETFKNKEIYNVMGLVRYILKGIEPRSARKFQIEPSGQGTIWGRRSAASKNLGRSARERDWEEGHVVRKHWTHRKPSIHAPDRPGVHHVEPRPLQDQDHATGEAVKLLHTPAVTALPASL